ncbi:MAG TPA: hypothetical protein VGO30_26665 [Mycobacterium sp.]|nr:hypothetical protein [Mycobacterium sp.]
MAVLGYIHCPRTVTELCINHGYGRGARARPQQVEYHVDRIGRGVLHRRAVRLHVIGEQNGPDPLAEARFQVPQDLLVPAGADDGRGTHRQSDCDARAAEVPGSATDEQCLARLQGRTPVASTSTRTSPVPIRGSGTSLMDSGLPNADGYSSRGYPDRRRNPWQP